jgi:hypothetical protein
MWDDEITGVEVNVAYLKVLSKHWSGGNSSRLLAVRYQVTWDTQNKDGLNVEVNLHFCVNDLKNEC